MCFICMIDRIVQRPWTWFVCTRTGQSRLAPATRRDSSLSSSKGYGMNDGWSLSANQLFFIGLRDSSFLCWQYLWYDAMDGHFRTIISTVRNPSQDQCLYYLFSFPKVFWFFISFSYFRKSISEPPSEPENVMLTEVSNKKKKPVLPIPEFININQVSRRVLKLKT